MAAGDTVSTEWQVIYSPKTICRIKSLTITGENIDKIEVYGSDTLTGAGSVLETVSSLSDVDHKIAGFDMANRARYKIKIVVTPTALVEAKIYTWSIELIREQDLEVG